MCIYKLLIYNFSETIYLYRSLKKNTILLFYQFVSNFKPVQIGTDEIINLLRFLIYKILIPRGCTVKCKHTRPFSEA